MLARNGKTYFTEKELRCKGSGQLRLASGFGEKLLDLREAFGHPMKITSACRSTSHNIAVKGAANSFHICDTLRGCCAVDVATPTPVYRTKLIKLALASGWSLGISRTFIHLDRRVDFMGESTQIVFTY